MRRKRKLFYVETGIGCGIRVGFTEEEIFSRELEYVGTHNGVKEVREATTQDIHNVKSMGGYIPNIGV